MTEEPVYPMRLNRYLALKNFASRREADALIQKGLVKINGKVAELGMKVNAQDLVEVNSKAKDKFKKYVYYAYNKPRGIVTHSPEEGQKAILDQVNLGKDIFPLGRLDKESHGLILLTNDGRITDKLLNPSGNHEKEYRVKVDKEINKLFLKHMANGIKLEDFTTKPCELKQKTENIFHIKLTEGKKHQIRRMCAAMGYVVHDLKRLRIMNITLGQLPEGRWRKLEGRELEKFLVELGL